MTPAENLYYAIGQLAFAVAFSDGKVQKEERERFHQIVSEELMTDKHGFDVSDIVFQVLDRDKMDASTVYDWSFKEIKQNSHYLSPEMKEKFINVMQKIAEAYPPVTADENSILSKFFNDIKDITGDPVYYNK
ncbi:MAG: TerB family tellurite resistance protein [Bacteroidia bacterium]